MPKAQRTYVLNLGMQTVSLAVFQVGANGGLTLEAVQTTELLIDPGADATRPAQLASAISELREKLNIKGQTPVNVVLPSQAVFSRFVQLPGAEAEDVEQIIPFEAQQNVPFPIDEVVWDHQILADKHEDVWDVILVAIKADQLDEVVRAVEEGGFTPTVIDAAPAALYNSFRYNYPDADGCSLLIDIGARTTNLIFIEGDRLFSRPVPVGGSTISAAIAKEFKQDITLAERVKVDKGFVSLGGAYAEPDDPMVAKVSKLVRGTLTRLHAEITRSIAFYRQNHHGSPPVRVLLSGGSVTLPYMVEFFSEKLQVPVEHFHALRNVTVASSDVAEAVQSRSYLLSDLIGGALREVGDCPVEINLRPSKLIAAEKMSRRFPVFATAAACLVLALASWTAFFFQASSVAEEQLSQVQSEVRRLESLSKKMRGASEDIKALQSQIAPILLAVDERAAWTALLDELGKNLPARHIWITSLEPVTGGAVIDPSSESIVPAGAVVKAAPAPTPKKTKKVKKPKRKGKTAPEPTPEPQGPVIDALRISGLYLDSPTNPDEARVIDKFVDSLSKSPLFKIEPTSAAKAKIVTQRTTPDGSRWAYGYTIEVPLAKPISLQ